MADLIVNTAQGWGIPLAPDPDDRATIRDYRRYLDSGQTPPVWMARLVAEIAAARFDPPGANSAASTLNRNLLWLSATETLNDLWGLSERQAAEWIHAQIGGRYSLTPDGVRQAVQRAKKVVTS